MALLRARVLIAAVASSLVAVGLVGSPATAAPHLTITDLAFSASHVDTTDGDKSVYLEWNVVNTDTRAITVTGVVEFREFQGSTSVGPVKSVNYSLRPGSAELWAQSGDAQNSNYRYEMLVPQWAKTPETSWRVTKITAQDGRGHTAKFSAAELVELGVQFTVTRSADVEAPTLNSVSLDTSRQSNRVFDDGSGVTLGYEISIEDVGLGFRKGNLVLTGPQGSRVTAPFEVTPVSSWESECGDEHPAYPPVNFAYCLALAEIPAGTPSGVWTVSTVRLTDVAGNTRALHGIEAPTVRVSRNDVLSATEFTVTPAVVDNWRTPTSSELTFKPVGAVGGLTAVDVVTGSFCWVSGTTPFLHEDGTASMTVMVPQGQERCEITGVALTDAAGNESYYGTPFGGASLGLVITRTPDNTPPVVLSATLPKSVWTQSEVEDAWGIGIDVTVDNTSGAPISGGSATLYDADGVPRGSGHGGYSEDPNGKVMLSVHPYSLPVGQYTVGFTLYDAAGQSSSYGYPNSPHQPPGGQLVITVTAG